MVPPSLSSTLTASCCGGERYFQATSAILRLPRGPVEWEGRRRGKVEGGGAAEGDAGKCSVTPVSRPIGRAVAGRGENYNSQQYGRRRFVRG